MSSPLAVEGRFTLMALLKGWAEKGKLTYKFSVHENALEPTRVRATFSKPTPEAPATAAVAHLYFRLDEQLRSVLGFTVESETHFHSLQELRFDEAVIDHVLRRKLALQQQRLIKLGDDFSSTRVPALMKQRDEEKREHDLEALEEYLLDRFQRKDPFNDGRISFQEFKDVLFTLEFPAVSRRDREIMFAFVELDRDDMVDYGALVGIGAEVMDTLLNAAPAYQKHAGAKAAKTSDHDAIDCFQAIVKHQQFATMDRLDRVLDGLRPPPPTPPPTGDAADDALETNAEATRESKGDANAGDHPTSVVPPSLPVELCVTRRQLRTSLESPQLLLSRAEINLIALLATTTSTGLIPCSQLGELLQHVQTKVFRFQSRCFTDRIGPYLMQQFMNYESSHLQGSAEHLKRRVRQREVKAVLKDMKKLLLSPFQASRLFVMCEESRTDMDRVVRYEDCIPKMSQWLRDQVDVDELSERASAVHEIHHSTAENSTLPDEELVCQQAVEAFELIDEKRVGMLSIADFHSSLESLSRALDMAWMGDEEMVAQVTALVDPLGQGRVNYVYFQQLIYPVLHWAHYERRGAQSLTKERRSNATSAEVKCGLDGDNERDDKEEEEGV